VNLILLLCLTVVAMKGNFLMGLNFVFVKLYPMRPGATLVSSLLVNTGIILTMTPAILQFCAQAFAQYAANSDISDIFGTQVRKCAPPLGCLGFKMSSLEYTLL
jgi:LMBR1 domain-containing protein 1